MKICVHFLCLSDVLGCGKLQIKVVVEIKTCFIKNKFFLEGHANFWGGEKNNRRGERNNYPLTHFLWYDIIIK